MILLIKIRRIYSGIWKGSVSERTQDVGSVQVWWGQQIRGWLPLKETLLLTVPKRRGHGTLGTSTQGGPSMAQEAAGARKKHGQKPSWWFFTGKNRQGRASGWAGPGLDTLIHFGRLWAVQVVCPVPGPRVILGRGIISRAAGSWQIEVGGSLDSELVGLRTKLGLQANRLLPLGIS